MEGKWKRSNTHPLGVTQGYKVRKVKRKTSEEIMGKKFLEL